MYNADERKDIQEMVAKILAEMHAGQPMKRKKIAERIDADIHEYLEKRYSTKIGKPPTGVSRSQDCPE